MIINNLKVGMKVILMPLQEAKDIFGLDYNNHPNIPRGCTENMLKYFGKVVTITFIENHNKYVKVKEDNQCWQWSFKLLMQHKTDKGNTLN